MHGTLIDKGTNVSFHQFRLSFDDDEMFGGRDDFLSNVAALENFREYPFGQFVAAISRAATETAGGFEKPALALAPKMLTFVCLNSDGARNAGE